MNFDPKFLLEKEDVGFRDPKALCAGNGALKWILKNVQLTLR
jgi:hypothetical protein